MFFDEVHFKTAKKLFKESERLSPDLVTDKAPRTLKRQHELELLLLNIATFNNKTLNYRLLMLSEKNS